MSAARRRRAVSPNAASDVRQPARADQETPVIRLRATPLAPFERDGVKMALTKAGATDVINYEEADVYEALQDLTGGRGPDSCIDAVGLEAHAHGPMYLMDRTKQSLMLETDRPLALRQAIRCCANGGVVSISGVYGGFIDQFPIGAVVNRSLTLRSGQCHAHRYMKPLLERIERGEIDPSFIITHQFPLAEAAKGYDLFHKKLDGCEKVVLKAA